MTNSWKSSIGDTVNDGSARAGLHQLMVDGDLTQFLEDRPANTPISMAYNFWMARCEAEGGLPKRENIDALELGPALLPPFVLLDIEQAHSIRFRYSLVGGYVEQIFGENYTGRYLDEMDLRPVKDTVIEFYRTASEQKKAVLLQGDYITRNRSAFKVLRLAMPMAWKGAEVGAIFAAFERDAWDAHDFAEH